VLQFLQIGVTVFGVVFLVELPDKTALATVVMASRMSAISVFVGVAVAFAVQSLVAVVAGSLLGFFSPRLIHAVAGLVFLVVAGVLFWQTRRQSEPAETPPTTESKWHHSPVVTAFVVVFASEWGDLSQLATAALQAQYQQPILVFGAAIPAAAATGTRPPQRQSLSPRSRSSSEIGSAHCSLAARFSWRPWRFPLSSV
jgi:putative Ca2+/H+ antiporter (TMEM165/GDT1 family)